MDFINNSPNYTFFPDIHQSGYQNTFHISLTATPLTENQSLAFRFSKDIFLKELRFTNQNTTKTSASTSSGF